MHSEKHRMSWMVILEVKRGFDQLATRRLCRRTETTVEIDSRLAWRKDRSVALANERGH